MPGSARDLFDAYVDDELSHAERTAFEAEVARDPDLRAELDDYRAVLRLVRELPPEPPPRSFIWAVQQRIRRRTRGRYFSYQSSRSLVFEAAVCAVLIFLLAALYLAGAVGVSPPAPESAAGDVTGRVTVAPADRRFLEEHAVIDMITTPVTGDGLEVHLRVPTAERQAFLDALAVHPRLQVVPTSLYREDGQVWMKVRAPAGPLPERW